MHAGQKLTFGSFAPTSALLARADMAAAISAPQRRQSDVLTRSYCRVARY